MIERSDLNFDINDHCLLDIERVFLLLKGQFELMDMKFLCIDSFHQFLSFNIKCLVVLYSVEPQIIDGQGQLLDLHVTTLSDIIDLIQFTLQLTYLKRTIKQLLILFCDQRLKLR